MKKILENYNCPVSSTLDLIGGKYKTLILWHLLDDTLRFSDLRRLIPEATPKMLTQQLRELETDALINRKIFPVIPPKVEYSLTKEGITLRPVLKAMFIWGGAHLKSKGLTPNCTMITPRKTKPAAKK
ncbi:MAG: helix-turn-helix transcriptional regulator [Endomicrobium sp.]|jgi:DNA-binding HxlR family transcriptional regulator|nr:helix-turn-helix transcriptional regulator [Endomicrobium sp.]